MTVIHATQYNYIQYIRTYIFEHIKFLAYSDEITSLFPEKNNLDLLAIRSN